MKLLASHPKSGRIDLSSFAAKAAGANFEYACRLIVAKNRIHELSNEDVE